MIYELSIISNRIILAIACTHWTRLEIAILRMKGGGGCFCYCCCHKIENSSIISTCTMTYYLKCYILAKIFTTQSLEDSIAVYILKRLKCICYYFPRATNGLKILEARLWLVGSSFSLDQWLRRIKIEQNFKSSFK